MGVLEDEVIGFLPIDLLQGYMLERKIFYTGI